MTRRSAIAIGILSTVTVASCRDRPAAVAEVRSIDASVGRPQSDSAPTDWKRGAVRFALSAVERQMTVTNSLAAMEGRVVEVGQRGWWKAELKSGNTAVLTGEGANRAVSAIDIYFELSDGLRLRDLVPILGPYTKVFESKTAGVRFDQAQKQGVVSFADLFSSKILPDSEVDRVSIRRAPMGNDHEK